MRGIKCGAGVVILGSLAFPGLVSRHGPAFAEKKSFTLCWEHSGLDVAGKPEDLDKAEITLTPPDGKPDSKEKQLGSLKVPTTKGSNQADLTPLLAGREPGKYLVWARVFDKSGNPSTWAGPVELVLTEPVQPMQPPKKAPEEPQKAGSKDFRKKIQKALPESDGKEAGKEPWKRHTPDDASMGCRSV